MDVENQYQTYIIILKMKLIKIGILFILFTVQVKSQKAQLIKEITTIPKILWTYWDSGYQGARLFTKLCINNMEFYSKKSGWEFRFLTQDNVTSFLSKQSKQRAKKMIETSKNHISIQNHVDIFRLFLLYENGGMWLDTNSFFVNDLSWIQNIDKETTPYNRISSDPDVITFTFSQYGGNKTRVVDDKTEQQIYLFPGIQIWSFITKPYSKFIKDVLQNLEYTLATPRDKIVQQNKEKGFLYGEEKDAYFITSNYQFQTVLQKKQKQIQKNSLQYSTQYAVDYYKIWSIDALTSAFALFEANDWTVGTVIKSLFYDSIQSYSQKRENKIYFIKFTSHFYPFINVFLPHIEYMTCLEVIAKIPKDSIISKHLLQPSLPMPIAVGIINEANNFSQNKQCNLFSKSITNRLITYTILIAMGIIFTNIFLFCLIKAGEDKSTIQ